ncbi:MAG TPA: type II secretion system F family protein [bacterium]|nr:type II secretion system F family protein [bacterium]
MIAGSAAYYFSNRLPKITAFSKISFNKPKSSLNAFQIGILVAILVSLTICVLVDTFTGVFLMLACVLTWYGKERGPQLLEKRKKNKIQNQMSELFPQALGMCIQALKTGQTVSQVLDYLSHECSQPLRAEIATVCAEMNLGLSAEAALTKMGERFPDFIEFHQFLESYKISRQTGANLTHLLQVLLDGMEEKNRLLRKMNAMTSQARLSGLVMGLLPFMLGLVFFVMDPSLMTPLFTTKAGWAILLLAGILESIGFLWIRQLLRLEL